VINFLRKYRFVAASVLVAAATMMGAYWWESLGHRGVSLFFIAALLCIGAVLGQNAAIFGALLAFASYKYFLVEPRHSFVTHPPDILAFIVFLLVALLVGGLSGRLSDWARAATERTWELQRLLNVSKDLAATISPEDAAAHTLSHLDGIVPSPRLTLHAAGAHTPSAEHPSDGRLSLRTARGELGVLDFDGDMLAPKRRELVEALMEISAIAIERATLLQEITKARVISEREALRTAMLSSLSHDLRTPVATILASSSTLANPDTRISTGQKHDIALAIQEEAQRLNRYIGNLIEMTRLQSGAINLREELFEPRDILDAVLDRNKSRIGGRTIVRDYQPRTHLILADPVLVEQALTNVLDNALSYTMAPAQITMGVAQAGQNVTLFIEDDGPGIPADEQTLIFERFFRGKNAGGAVNGLGLGLSVVRGIVDAFGGSVAVVSPVRDGRGVRVSLNFPAAKQD
jgi:K+-sensing histidine kinase KdpD